MAIYTEINSVWGVPSSSKSRGTCPSVPVYAYVARCDFRVLPLTIRFQAEGDEVGQQREVDERKRPRLPLSALSVHQQQRQTGLLPQGDAQHATAQVLLLRPPRSLPESNDETHAAASQRNDCQVRETHSVADKRCQQRLVTAK